MKKPNKISLKRNFSRIQLPITLAYRKLLFAKRAFANELPDVDSKEFLFGFQGFDLDGVRATISTEFPGLALSDDFFKDCKNFAGIIYVDQDAESGFLSIRVKKLYRLPTDEVPFGEIDSTNYLFDKEGKLVNTDSSIYAITPEGLEIKQHSLDNISQVPEAFEPVFSTDNPAIGLPNTGSEEALLEPLPVLLSEYSRHFSAVPFDGSYYEVSKTIATVKQEWAKNTAFIDKLNTLQSKLSLPDDAIITVFNCSSDTNETIKPQSITPVTPDVLVKYYGIAVDMPSSSTVEITGRKIAGEKVYFDFGPRTIRTGGSRISMHVVTGPGQEYVVSRIPEVELNKGTGLSQLESLDPANSIWITTALSSQLGTLGSILKELGKTVEKGQSYLKIDSDEPIKPYDLLKEVSKGLEKLGWKINTVDVIKSKKSAKLRYVNGKNYFNFVITMQ